MRKYRVSLTIQGEDRLGTLIGLLAKESGYMDGLEVTEIARTSTETPKRRKGASPTPEERATWAAKYWPVIKESLGDKAMHSDQIGILVERATPNLSASSISPLLSELYKAGKVIRVGRGIYRVA